MSETLDLAFKISVVLVALGVIGWVSLIAAGRRRLPSRPTCSHPEVRFERSVALGNDEDSTLCVGYCLVCHEKYTETIPIPGPEHGYYLPPMTEQKEGWHDRVSRFFVSKDYRYDPVKDTWLR